MNERQKKAALVALRNAVRAEVSLHLALREIERIVGRDAVGLDEYVSALSLGCARSGEVFGKIGAADLDGVLASCFSE